MSPGRSRIVAALAACVLVACGDRAPPASDATTPVATDEPAAAPPATPEPALPAPPADAGFAALHAGVIAATDTLDTLRARHGYDQVVATKVPGAEGEELDGWVLFPADPTRRGYVYFDESGSRPSMVRVLDPESRWQRADGIRTGLTLAELARRNGAPVGFMGFDWDYGGGITGWNGGRFDRDPPLGMVQLCPPPMDDTGEGYPAGDSEFDSNNAWVVAHPPVVCAFSVSLPAPEPPAAEPPA